MSTEDDLFIAMKRELTKSREEQSSKPFIVSVMGQTGVGKSSLVNALFGQHFRTDPIKPCTKEIERAVVSSDGGFELWFYDLPGIGEAEDVDSGYIETYRKTLIESDVVLWAVHADNRSVVFDKKAIALLLDVDPAIRALLASKLTLVLTKVDLLSPTPWLFLKNGERGMFAPNPDLNDILTQKAAYFCEAFLEGHADSITAYTFNDTRFNLSLDGFLFSPAAVWYSGRLTPEAVATLSLKYPSHAGIFARLRDNYEAIPCSAAFRFNLERLMTVILNKLGPEAIHRFSNIVLPSLSEVDTATAGRSGNIMVLDRGTRRVTLDMAHEIRRA